MTILVQDSLAAAAVVVVAVGVVVALKEVADLEKTAAAAEPDDVARPNEEGHNLLPDSVSSLDQMDKTLVFVTPVVDYAQQIGDGSALVEKADCSAVSPDLAADRRKTFSNGAMLRSLICKADLPHGLRMQAVIEERPCWYALIVVAVDAAKTSYGRGLEDRTVQTKYSDVETLADLEELSTHKVRQVVVTSLEEVLQWEAEHFVESSFLDRSAQSNLCLLVMVQSLCLVQNHNLTFVEQSASRMVVQ